MLDLLVGIIGKFNLGRKEEEIKCKEIEEQSSERKIQELIEKEKKVKD